MYTTNMKYYRAKTLGALRYKIVCQESNSSLARYAVHNHKNANYATVPHVPC